MFHGIKGKISNLKADPNMSEVVRSSLLAFVLKVGGSGLAFAFNVVLARILGAQGTGIYFLALSVSAIGSVIGRVGLDNSMLRFTAEHAAKGEWGKVEGVYSLGMKIAVVASGSLALIGFILAPWLSESLFQKSDLAEPLRWMSLSILPFAVLNLQAESFKGIKNIRNAMLLQSIGVPLFGLFLIWPLAQIAAVTGAAWTYFTATSLVMFIGLGSWRRKTAENITNIPPYPFHDLWASCKPLLITSVMNRAVMPWVPFFLLGIWATSEEVGIFGAASRVALLVGFMLTTVNNVLAPKFSELYAKGEMEAMRQTAQRSALLMTVLASPLFVVMIFGGKWIMIMFGPAFVNGSFVLAILAAGQFVNSLTGSVNYVLIATGNEAIVRNTTLLWATIQIVICFLLIPSQGYLGAAIAMATATAGINLTAAYMVWKQTGIITIPFLRGKP